MLEATWAWMLMSMLSSIGKVAIDDGDDDDDDDENFTGPASRFIVL